MLRSVIPNLTKKSTGRSLTSCRYDLWQQFQPLCPPRSSRVAQTRARGLRSLHHTRQQARVTGLDMCQSFTSHFPGQQSFSMALHFTHGLKRLSQLSFTHFRLIPILCPIMTFHSFRSDGLLWRVWKAITALVNHIAPIAMTTESSSIASCSTRDGLHLVARSTR